MKVTIYELLGMIKDNKAPEDIKTCDYFWEWNKNKRDYIKLGEEELSLFKDYLNNDIVNSLTDEVEIIEEKKIPEKLKLYAPYPECDDTRFEEVENKINEIIDYLKSKGE